MKCHCRYNNPSYTIVYSCCIGTRLMSLRMRDCVSFGGNFEWKRVGTLFPLLERILDGNANNFQAKSALDCRISYCITYNRKVLRPDLRKCPRCLHPNTNFRLARKRWGTFVFVIRNDRWSLCSVKKKTCCRVATQLH